MLRLKLNSAAITTLLILATSLKGWAQQSAAPTSGPKLPIEVIGYSSIATEIRSRLGLKFRDLRQNYSITERDPGNLDLKNAANQRIAQLSLSRWISDDKKSRFERVSLIDYQNQVLLEETIQTRGENLTYSNPMERLFFTGDVNQLYDLNPNETSKNIAIRIDTSTAFEFNIAREKTGDGTQTLYDFYINKAQMLQIRKMESLAGAPTIRTQVEYQTYNNMFGLLAFDRRYVVTPAISPGITYRVTASRSDGFLGDTIQFYRNGLEVYGLSPFLSDFNGEVYQNIVVNGVIAIMDNVILPAQPPTVRLANLAASTRFLDDLINLRSLVEQAKSNPTQLIQVSGLINQYISSIQDGTLMINDNRPKPKK